MLVVGVLVVVGVVVGVVVVGVDETESVRIVVGVESVRVAGSVVLVPVRAPSESVRVLRCTSPALLSVRTRPVESARVVGVVSERVVVVVVVGVVGDVVVVCALSASGATASAAAMTMCFMMPPGGPRDAP